MCGNIGCQCLRCGGKYLERLAAERYPDTAFEQLFLSHGQEEPVREFVKDMAVPVIEIANILDPELIFIAGGVTAVSYTHLSQVTIRKDLDVLEGKRLIRRQQGFAELDSEDDVTNRLAYHHKEKLAIAEAAVSQIKNGETVMIESGSCCALLAEQIVKKLKDVTIITNSVYIAEHIRPALGNHVILLGGEIQMEPMVTVGPITVSYTHLDVYKRQVETFNRF